MNEPSPRADAGSGSGLYEPTRAEDVLFPDWVLVGSRSRIQALQAVWLEGTSRCRVEPLVHGFVLDSQNPFWTALHLCISCADYKDVARRGSATLAHRVMSSFATWLVLKPLRQQEVKALRSEDRLAVSAFAAAFFQFCPSFYQLMLGAYRFDARPAPLVPYVRRAVEGRRFNEACLYIATLGLWDAFDLADVVLPLYAQNMTGQVHTYLRGHQGQQVQFVELLDRMCAGDAESVYESLHKRQIPNIRETMFEHKTLCKVIKNLAAKYQVEEAHWPEALHAHHASTLRYFLNQFYKDGAVPAEDWNDMLADFLAGNQRLQREALDLMVSYGDLDRAVDFAVRFGFGADDGELPDEVQAAVARRGAGAASSQTCAPRLAQLSHYGIDDGYDEDEDEDDDDYGDRWGYDEEGDVCAAPAAAAAPAIVPKGVFYASDVPEENVHLVDTKEEYEKCIRTIEKNAKTLAMDCEWRSLVHDNKVRLALLQLATEKRYVYLLDVLSLREQLSGEHWESLVDRVFSNPAIEKLGFSFQGDWKMLAGVHVALADLRKWTMNVTDVMTLCNKILDKNPQLFNHFKGSKPNGRSLSTFIELCMGKPLDKTEQFSDWERRPLRPSQKSYAATDVCCLLDIYESLKSNCTSQGVDIATFK